MIKYIAASLIASTIVVHAIGTEIVNNPETVVIKETQIYSENIQIINDQNIIIATIDVYGKVILSEKSNYDDVINMLIQRMVKQDIIAKQQMQQLINALQVDRQKAQATLVKASEIIKIYIPEPAPAPAVKEEPKKKGWFSWLRKK